jgi:hypothetical protein
MKLTQVPRPFLCCVLLDDPTPGGVIGRIRLAEAIGAQAFELDLHVLEPEARTAEALAPVFASTNCPIFTTYRRFDFSKAEEKLLSPDEDERIGRQLELISAGSAGFDMEMDSFDPGFETGEMSPAPWFSSDEGLRYSHDPESPPREVSHDPAADRRQKEVVAEAHRLGGEVILSTHALTRMDPDGALRIGRLAEERGADVVKIVRLCVSREDTVETLATNVLLGRELSIPFVMMAMGEYGKLSRPLAPLFGSMLVFGRQTYAPGTFTDQPLIGNLRAVLENVDTSITPNAAKYLPPEMR